METMLFALLLLALADGLLLRPRSGALLAGLAAALSLCRVEGPFWAVGLALLALLARPEWRHGARHALLAALAATALQRGISLAWYGELLPNTVRVKVSPGAGSLAAGASYVVHFTLTFLTPLALLLAPLALAWRRRDAALVLLVVAGVYAWAVATGGDWMLMGRFLVPGFAFATLLVGWAMGTLWRGWLRAAAGALAALHVAVGLLPAWEVHLVPAATRAAWSIRWDDDRALSEVALWRRWQRNIGPRRRLARALAQVYGPEASIVWGAIGVLGYYSGLTIYDQYGLVSRAVATHKTPDAADPPGHQRHARARFFLDQEPTLMGARLLAAEGQREVTGSQAAEWRRSKAVSRRYAPVLHRLASGEVLLTLERVADGADAEAAWAAALGDTEDAGAPGD